MAQPNVVREPSMDEILASIRRIIESNEPVASASSAEPFGFNGRPANDDAYESSDDVPLTIDDSFGDPASDGESPAVTPDERFGHPLPNFVEAGPARGLREPQSSEPKPLSLADVAARVRAASERSASLRDTMPPQLFSARHEDMQNTIDDDDRSSQRAPEPQVAAHQPDTSGIDDLGSQAETRAPVAIAHSEDRTARDSDESGSAGGVTSLVSSSVGQRVAQSFQDLAVALEEAERRSLDEIAEEMLRPMLQEWLDDNLPTLVERLVREEIERVARGPRR